MQGEFGFEQTPEGSVSASMGLAAGPIEVEALLLDELEILERQTRAEPALLARPIRVVVPSRSLREHLCSRIAGHFGHSLLGLKVQTLHSLASEVLERTGRSRPDASGLLPVFVRQAAREEIELQKALGHLTNGFESLTGAVVDCIDAGFTPSLSEVVEECLEDLGSSSAVRRAQAIARISVNVLRSFEALEVTHAAEIIQRAKQEIEANPSEALPARRILIHGFSDATGVATDLIEALLRHRAAHVLLDRPRDPAQPSRLDPGCIFIERFRERIEGVASMVSRKPNAKNFENEIQLFGAPGHDAEVREVACRIRSLLDAGQVPESIAVIARDIEPYASSLRIQLARMGVPFSAPTTMGSRGGAARLAMRVLRLLQEELRLPVASWAALCMEEEEGFAARSDLALALTVSGAMRLGDLEGISVRDVDLPVCNGLTTSNDEEKNRSRVRADRRRVPRASLRAVIEKAAKAKEHWRSWPQKTSLVRHAALLKDFLSEVLGWQSGEGLAGWLEYNIENGSEACVLSYEDFLFFLESELEEFDRIPLGGEGGGVRVLSVMDARACTFENLFLLGMNRDLFPRRITEDPLLPDWIRERLLDVLPDFSVKRRGFDEERFLFAQICASSPRITISYRTVSDSGKLESVSPLFERIRLVRQDLEEKVTPSLFAANAEWNERPAFEYAILSGLYAEREASEGTLPLAIQERGSSSRDSQSLAKARAAVLSEFDPFSSTRWGPGPYFGFVGSVCSESDPRSNPLYVTTLESLSKCPWQTFLSRILRVEPTPDLMASLTTQDARLRGTVIHGILERIACPEEIEESSGSSEVAQVSWPKKETLEAWIEEAATEALGKSPSVFPGMKPVLIADLRRYLEVARELDWPNEESSVPVLAVEVEGQVSVKNTRDESRELFFKTDRIDLGEEGFRLTDYKAGKSFATQKKPETRHKTVLEAVAKGERLQAMAYALSAAPEKAAGRYLFLHPDAKGELLLSFDDEEAAKRFHGAVAVLLDAWERGIFFPRLVDANGRNEPAACGYCDLSQACLRGDSGIRGRIVDWVAEQSSEGEMERTFLEAWKLAAGKST